jgi:hypothetical protein
LNRSKLRIADRIAAVNTDVQFDAMAMEFFERQRNSTSVYSDFIDRLNGIKSEPFPFLPIEAFKHHRIGDDQNSNVVFKSSGTTGSNRSSHYVSDIEIYKELSQSAFEHLFGPLSDKTVLALLPSYLENGDSSLVFMVNHFIDVAASNSQFVSDPLVIVTLLNSLKERDQPTLLIGVSYALLDMAERHSFDWSGLSVMETGGMKGRKKELTRGELHRALMLGFPSSSIHSEYGMTELLSQAYAVDGEWFSTPPWMRVYITSVSDPFHVLGPNQRGLLAFIDLANVHGCSFIQTRDIGIINSSGLFKVEGRLDNSDIRGCNLLYT